MRTSMITLIPATRSCIKWSDLLLKLAGTNWKETAMDLCQCCWSIEWSACEMRTHIVNWQLDVWYRNRHRPAPPRPRVKLSCM